MQRITTTLIKSSCDAILIPSELSCNYFTGFHSDFCYIIASNDFVRYYTDKRYYEEARTKLSIDVRLIGADNYLSVLSEDLMPYNTVGIDESKVYYSDYKKLLSVVSGKTIVDISDIVRDIKAIKNNDEIEITKKAVNIADETFSEIIGKIGEGITEKELTRLVENTMFDKGADGIAFNTIVAFSENSAYPHWHNSDRKLKYGDNILLDYGAQYHGYCSDMTRVLSFGKPSEDYVKLYNIVLEANRRAIDNIEAEMTTHMADSFARDYIHSQGYGEYFNHSLGHGIGMEVHEYPRLSKGSYAILKSGMLFTVEPGIYIEGKYGVRIEDLVLLDDKKVIILTQSDKKLIVI